MEDINKPDKKITYEDFKKVEMKVGQIISAEKIPDTDKLLKLSVDFAENAPRQIVSGIAMHFSDLTELVGKKCMFVTNLEPRTIKGFVSDGMILAVGDGESFSLLEPNSEIIPGSSAR
ncbi:MAG: methionine--tRNA ligase subunit beta [bacterium]